MGAVRFLSKNTPTITHTLNGSKSYTIGSGGDIDTIRPSAIFTAYYTLGGFRLSITSFGLQNIYEIGTKNIRAIPEYVVLKPDYPL